MQALRLPVVTEARRRQHIQVLVGLNILAYFTALLSITWDTAEHTKGAVDSFWYPPHFGIYFSLLAAALVSAYGLFLTLRSPGTLGEKLRRSPALVALTVANVIGFTGAPFDAWWHVTFGIDLTAWSPPHIHLIVGSVMVLVACSVYFLDSRPTEDEARLLIRPGRRDLVLAAAFAMAMLLGSVGFLDYEAAVAPSQTSGFSAAVLEILARPRWSYPVAMTGFTLFLLLIATASSRRIGNATLATTIYALVRLGQILMSSTLLDYQGAPFYPVLIPALVLDLTLAASLVVPQLRRARWAAIALASLLAALSMIITAPMVWSRHLVQPTLNIHPWSAYWLPILGVGLAFGLAGWWVGTRMRTIRPDLTAQS
jgi:hypothetical protein